MFYIFKKNQKLNKHVKINTYKIINVNIQMTTFKLILKFKINFNICIHTFLIY